MICPFVICTTQDIPCTPEQIETYVRLCPDCIPFAGCKQPGCDCRDCKGNLLTPPTNPPQPPRDFECSNCTTVCPKDLRRCPSPGQCTSTQLATYVPKCPECVPEAGCRQVGCDCTDYNGYVRIPPPNPPQPPRPIGCPKCSTLCFVSDFVCPPPSRCDAEQLETYVYRDPVAR